MAVIKLEGDVVAESHGVAKLKPAQFCPHGFNTRHPCLQCDMARPLNASLARTAHGLLCARAEKWLESINCKVVFSELVANVTSGEIPDAIGWVNGYSILVECKTTRADFLADKRKPFRLVPENGMGDYRLFMCPPGVIAVEELPPGWGLLYAHDKKIERVKCFRTPCQAHRDPPPFVGHKRNEMAMMLSALRRLKLRGRLDEIYDAAPPELDRG